MANRTMPSVYIRVILFSGKTKSPCFDLFIHSPIKQITNTYRNNFSRSHKNRSIFETATVFFTFFASTQLKPLTEWIHLMKPRLFETILRSGLRHRPYESGWKNCWVSKRLDSCGQDLKNCFICISSYSRELTHNLRKNNKQTRWPLGKQNTQER